MPVIINSTKSSNITYVDFADIIQYEFVINNTGDTTVTDVFLIDTLPTEVYFTSNSVFINGANSLNYFPNIPITLPDIAPNDTVTITFEAAVSSIFPISNSFTNTGNLVFSYVVTATNFRTSQLTNSETHFINKALLDVQKFTDDFTGLFYPLTTTIVISNSGNTLAEDLILKEVLDDGMAVDNSSIIEDGSSISGDLLVGVSLNNLAPAQTKTVSYDILVESLPALNFVETFNNLYYSYKVDPATTINSVALTGSYYEATTVTSAVISSNLTVSPPTVGVGDTIIYTLVLTNIGNSSGQYINVLDTLPSLVTFDIGSVFINGSNFPIYDPNISISIPDMSISDVVTITYSATVDTIPLIQPVDNTALIDFKDTIPNSSILNSLTTISNIASFNTINTDLIFTKSSSSFFSAPGLTITYTLEINNASNVDIFNSILYDTLPTDVTFVPNSIRVNSIPTAGDPSLGISLFTIPQNTITTVTFDVTVS